MSRIHIDQQVDLTADNISSHVYGDGSAYLDLGSRGLVFQNLMIWIAKKGDDPAEDARMLRRLAEVASGLADHLENWASEGTV